MLVLLVGVMLIKWQQNYFNTSITSSSQLEMTYSEYYKQVGILNGKPIIGPDGKPLPHNVKTAEFVGSESIIGEFVEPVQGKTKYKVYQLSHDNFQLAQDLIASRAKVTSSPAQRGPSL
jgi:hypothetical protein